MSNTFGRKDNNDTLKDKEIFQLPSSLREGIDTLLLEENEAEMTEVMKEGQRQGRVGVDRISPSGVHEMTSPSHIQVIQGGVIDRHAIPSFNTIQSIRGSQSQSQKPQWTSHSLPTYNYNYSNSSNNNNNSNNSNNYNSINNYNYNPYQCYHDTRQHIKQMRNLQQQQQHLRQQPLPGLLHPYPSSSSSLHQNQQLPEYTMDITPVDQLETVVNNSNNNNGNNSNHSTNSIATITPCVSVDTPFSLFSFPIARSPLQTSPTSPDLDPMRARELNGGSSSTSSSHTSQPPTSQPQYNPMAPGPFALNLPSHQLHSLQFQGQGSPDAHANQYSLSVLGPEFSVWEKVQGGVETEGCGRYVGHDINSNNNTTLLQLPHRESVSGHVRASSFGNFGAPTATSTGVPEYYNHLSPAILDQRLDSVSAISPQVGVFDDVSRSGRNGVSGLVGPFSSLSLDGLHQHSIVGSYVDPLHVGGSGSISIAGIERVERGTGTQVYTQGHVHPKGHLQLPTTLPRPTTTNINTTIHVGVGVGMGVGKGKGEGVDVNFNTRKVLDGNVLSRSGGSGEVVNGLDSLATCNHGNDNGKLLGEVIKEGNSGPTNQGTEDTGVTSWHEGEEGEEVEKPIVKERRRGKRGGKRFRCDRGLCCHSIQCKRTHPTGWKPCPNMVIGGCADSTCPASCHREMCENFFTCTRKLCCYGHSWGRTGLDMQHIAPSLGPQVDLSARPGHLP
eukprot:Ihof_evm3s276 gene=Ihof_evmTU3s276